MDEINEFVEYVEKIEKRIYKNEIIVAKLNFENGIHVIEEDKILAKLKNEKESENENNNKFKFSK